MNLKKRSRTVLLALTTLATPALAQSPAGAPASQPASAPHDHKAGSHDHEAAPHDHHPGPHDKHSGHHHSFENAEKWAKRFDAETRAAWQKPDAVVAMLNLRPDAHVTDLGSGTGYFAVRIAAAVPAGHVWGVDLEPDMVRYLNERAAKEKHANLTSVQGRSDGFTIGAKSDMVLVVDTYHHIQSRTDYFRAVRAQLADRGVVTIVDFKKAETAHGPPARMRLSAQSVIDEMSAAGYQLMVYDDASLPEQYVLMFTPKRAG